DCKALSVQTIVTERETRAVVHGRLVVDHRDLPTRALFRRPAARIVDQMDDVVLSHAPCPSLCSLRRLSFAGRNAGEGDAKPSTPAEPGFEGQEAARLLRTQIDGNVQGQARSAL